MKGCETERSVHRHEQPVVVYQSNSIEGCSSPIHMMYSLHEEHFWDERSMNLVREKIRKEYLPIQELYQ